MSLLDNVIQAIAIQSNIGAPSYVGSNYYGFLSNPLPPQIPQNETIDDSAMVGDGFSRTTRNHYNYYWTEKGLQVAGMLNDHISSILMNAYLAGLRTITNRVTPSKDYLTLQKMTNINPALLSIYRHLEGEKFILGDMFPNAFNISQDGSASPNASFDLLSTGLFRDSDQLTANSFDEAQIVVAPEYEYFHGAATVFTMTDGVTTYDFSAQKQLLSLSVEGSNGGSTARRIGDSFYNASDRNSGAFASKSRLGKTMASAKVKIDLGADLPYFKAMAQRKKLTGGGIKFVGFNNIASSGDAYEYNIDFPVSRFRVVEGDTDQDYGALSLTIDFERDNVTKGLFKHTCRTDKTLI